MSGPPPRPLRETQVWMVSAITGAAHDAPAQDVERFITAGPRMTAAERLEVYRAGYQARLHECLLDDYPVLAAMLEHEHETQFIALCRAYVARHPSASPNLNGFGRNMASFCREAELERLPSFARLPRGGFATFASELATLEWALVEVLHAETAPPLESSALQALSPDDWARARFIASDALRVFRFAYPVNGVFTQNRIEGTIPDVPSPQPNAVAVYRKDLTLWRMDLTPPMVSVLEPLLAGKTLGEALVTVDEQATSPVELAQTGANLMVWFREWVDAGFFTRIELEPESTA